MEAVQENEAEAVRNLATRLGPCGACTQALKKAAELGHLAAVLALIPVGNPHHNHSEALFLAVLKVHPAVVDALIPVSDPKADRSAALSVATQLGHNDLVERLLGVSDPTADGSNAFLCATADGAWDLAELFLPFPHRRKALKEALKKASMSWEGIESTHHASFLRRLLSACPVPVVDDVCTELLGQHDFAGVGRLMPHASPRWRRTVDESALAGAPAQHAQWQILMLEAATGAAPRKARKRL